MYFHFFTSSGPCECRLCSRDDILIKAGYEKILKSLPINIQNGDILTEILFNEIYAELNIPLSLYELCIQNAEKHDREMVMQGNMTYLNNLPWTLLTEVEFYDYFEGEKYKNTQFLKFIKSHINKRIEIKKSHPKHYMKTGIKYM